MGIGDDIINTDGFPPGGNPDDVTNADIQIAPGPVVAEHNIDIPESDHPCFAFPQLTLPSFSFQLPELHLPQITFPEICCPGTSAPVFGGGFLADFQLPFTTPGVNYDHNDPRVSTKDSDEDTIVSTPTQPQHISKEIAKVAPTVGAEVLGEFSSLLISIASTPQHVLDFINALGNKAAAIADLGAKALGDGMASLLNGLGDGVDWLTGFASSGLADATNQAAAMVPIRQIPLGIRDPNKKHGKYGSFSSSGMRSDWPNQPGGNPLSFLDNALKLGNDLFNAVGGQCLFGGGADSLSRAAQLAAQGLGLPALGMQLDGMLRMAMLAPLNLADGLHQLLHGWRFDCGLKHDPVPPIHRPDQVRQSLSQVSRCPTGAMPGNLMHAAYADDGEPAAGKSLVGHAPVAIAQRLGSPYAGEIAKFVTDPDPRYDSMVSSLPSYYQAGDPRYAQLLEVLLAFQQVYQAIIALKPGTIPRMVSHSTAFGGAFVSFVRDLHESYLARPTVLGAPDQLASNFTNNRLTNDQHDTIVNWIGVWNNLGVDIVHVDTSDVLTAEEKTLTHTVLDPLQPFGSTDLRALVAAAPDILNNFGGHIGPEVAYAASNQAIMTRSLLLIEKNEGNEKETVNRISKMAKVGTEHAKEVTAGGAYTTYMQSLANVDSGSAMDMVHAGMPAAVTATQDLLDHQQKTMAAATEMLAQARGGTTVESAEEANDINHLKENTDTQAYLSGALEHQHDTIKSVLTKSVPSVAGAAKMLVDAEITDLPTARAAHVERIVKETANALASTTLAKTTGVKLDQQSEGHVHQSKFSLQQAGSSIAHEAPVVRQTARMLVHQAQHKLSEADAHDVRGQWLYHLIEKATGFMTGAWQLIVKNELIQTAKKAYYFGQEGTQVGDKTSITLDVDGGKAQIDVTGNKLVIQLGAACIVMDPSGRIDLNPTSKPSPRTVTNKHVDPPALDTTKDKAPAVLPTRGQRNPVPCAAPYSQPKDVLRKLQGD
jgi:hypothetical protein